VEPDYVHDSDVFFSCSWISFLDRGCGGDSPPPQLSLGQGRGRGGDEINGDPSGERFEGSTPGVKFYEKIPCKILDFRSQSGSFIIRSQIRQ
jgi:hypothetical protein